MNLSRAAKSFLQALKSKKYRQKYRQFLVEGEKPFTELLSSGWSVSKVYATSDWWEQQSLNIPDPILLTRQEMEQVSTHESPQGVIAVVDMPTEQPLKIATGKFYLALDHIQDPGNLGTLIRIADWYGLAGILCSHDCTDCFSPKVVNSTMGSLFRIPPSYVNLQQVLENAGMPVYGALLNGKNLHALDQVTPGIILLGNEANGIREQHLAFITHPVTIPGAGRAESLNVAVAGAVITDNLIQRSV